MDDTPRGLDIPEETLGLGLRPGASHYRAYVGPPDDYDMVAAMSMGLLTTLGLRQQHRLLDIGCGSLRIGRLLIPYLNRGGYTGLEPNEWLVREGIANEVGADQVRIKQPQFVFSGSAATLVDEGRTYDFMLAQSIFSHTGLDLLEQWLEQASRLLSASGALVATFLPAESDPEQSGWIYPDCVRFRTQTVQAVANRHGLDFALLDWRHPRQSWAIFAKPDFDPDWYKGQLTWNGCFDRINRSRQVSRSPA